VQDVSLTCVLFATILCLYIRPFGAHDWQIASVGALAAWVIGPFGFGDGIEVIADSGNIVAFFFGLMLIAAAADAAGLYARAAELFRARKTARARVVAVVVTGTAITALLSNDATPLILTPAIFATGLAAASTTRKAALAATLTADGASLLLPVSNPVNLLFFERFDLGRGHYLATITPAAAAGVAAMAIVLLLRAPREALVEEPSAPAIVAERNPWPALAVVGVLAVAYVAAGIVGVPLGAVTVAGGAAMLAAARLGGPIEASHVRKYLAPGVLIFVAALMLLVESVSEAGVLGPLSSVLESLAELPVFLTVLGAALVAAVLSNLVNNWPAALVLAATIGSTAGDHDALVAGSLVGCAIGANFTMVGSLSTVFWLSLARQSGTNFTHGEYARSAFLPTAAALLAACAVAALLI
jgi:arsenical pump membrane protein